MNIDTGIEIPGTGEKFFRNCRKGICHLRQPKNIFDINCICDCKWLKYEKSLDRSKFVYAATDHDDSEVCIGRVHHEGEIIPGKVLLRHEVFHFCHDGEEICVPDFEVLIKEADDEFEWIESEDGKVPANAVVGGKSKSGENYFIGRAQHLWLTIPGKIVPSDECLYVPCDWKQHRKNKYEVLVKKIKTTGWRPPFIETPRVIRSVESAQKRNIEWIHWSPGKSWPHNAVPAGIYNEGDFNKFQYIARRRHNGNMILGYAYINGPFYSGYHGHEISHGDFELLIENSEIFPKETL